MQGALLYGPHRRYGGKRGDETARRSWGLFYTEFEEDGQYQFIHELNVAVPGGRISHTVFLISLDRATINAIHVAVGTSWGQFPEKFRQYWGRYSVRNMLIDFGMPNDLLVDSTDEAGIAGKYMLLGYQETGVYVNWYGEQPEIAICPESSANALSLDLMLVEPATELADQLWGELIFRYRHVPFEQFYEVPAEDFLRQVVASSDFCFYP